MTKHKSSIDFEHFLDDLISMYSYSIEEACLIEVIANSLDAKCNKIEVKVDKENSTLEITDNGNGMDEKTFKEYHNFAYSPKKKGHGIGFAGLGAKLALRMCNKIITETKSKDFIGASEWFFEGKEPIWNDIDRHTLTNFGTKVAFHLNKKDYIILDIEKVKEIIARHYTPLLEKEFSQIYKSIYPNEIKFYVNGELLKKEIFSDEKIDKKKIVPLKRRQSLIGICYFVLSKEKVEEEFQGIGICTYGKVIRRDNFKKYPNEGEKITGLIETPLLVECLTTNKNDFVKSGGEGQKYYQTYKEMQKEFGTWLEEIGKIEKQELDFKDAEKMENLVKQILKQIPDLQNLFFGSQAKKKVSIPLNNGNVMGIEVSGTQKVSGTLSGNDSGEGVNVFLGHGDEEGIDTSQEGKKSAIERLRTIKFGPKAAWENAENRDEIGWVSEDTIVINSGNSVYKKAEENGWKSYHDLLSIAYAVIEYKTEQKEAFKLFSQFFKAWGNIK